jgi:ssDNA-binding replication factor A large subunit
MKISELNQGVPSDQVNVTGTVTSMSAPRDVTTRSGSQARVVSAVLKDDSGEITLSLWNEDIDKVRVGSTVTVSKGYVSSFQGKPQLSRGRSGSLTVQ